MSLPGVLIQAIEWAHVAVRKHPQHDLSLGYRQAIWAAMGPRQRPSAAVNPVGLERRTTLAVEATRHVLPIWQQRFPNDTTPQQILDEVDRLLDGQVTIQQATDDRGNFWEYFDELVYQDEDNTNAASVGTAAVQALSAAIFDEDFPANNIDYQRVDKGTDPYELDASFYAAAAYAGGAVWEETSSSAKRREFWEWWLNEAVPSAYMAIS